MLMDWNGGVNDSLKGYVRMYLIISNNEIDEIAKEGSVREPLPVHDTCLHDAIQH